MSSLIIEHGNPWWLSPNVWVVPSADPNTPSPGVVNPSVGQQYNLAANIHNTGNGNVLDASVYFWWANPSLGIITTVNAHLIGTSSVSVDAGQSVNTLELAPWSPVFQNGGHECVIAAVVESGGLPPTVLDGNSDPTVAQHNLGVVQVAPHMRGRFHYPFQVCNTARVERQFVVTAQSAPLSQAGRALPAGVAHEQQGKIENLGFVSSVCPDSSEDAEARPILESVRLAPYSCTGFSLVGMLTEGSALVHVTQTFQDRIVGGLSVLILTNGRVQQ